MPKILFCLFLILTALTVFLPMGAYAQNTDVPILFVNTIANAVAGVELPEVLLTPAGYENVKTVTTNDDFLKEWENRNQYYVLIFAYHSFANDANLATWAADEAANLEKWVQSHGILIVTAGRDAQEKPIADVFGLTFSDPGTGTEAIVPVDPAFAKDIAGNQMDASQSSDNTPLNGQIYDDPLPSWVEYVVTSNAAGNPTSVIGHYGNGVAWLGAGFEITNIGTGIDAEQTLFTGYKALWKNVLDWATTGVTPVEYSDKLVSTWGSLKIPH